MTPGTFRSQASIICREGKTNRKWHSSCLHLLHAKRTDSHEHALTAPPRGAPDPPRLRGRQVAQYPHPTLPALRAQLSIPALRFFFSAARVQRLMRVLRSALPGARPPAAAAQGKPAWQLCSGSRRPGCAGRTR